ncbi:MAG: cadmium-translocating P-type ATPase [Rhodospirillales bacterium]|nr:cadmium-translocating P-type ATPase [Rhodospirillales bacterium]MBO6788459.1 cadmium-translocating P-type ATPase [Rhodospirillales bacterium]
MNAIEPAKRVALPADAGIADCCDAGALVNYTVAARGAQAVDENLIAPSDPSTFVTHTGDGLAHLNLLVENLQCAACIGKIEGRLKSFPGVEAARVNMSTRRLAVAWQDGEADPSEMMRAVQALGYPVTPYDPAELAGTESREDKRLLSAMAVAGFAAANVMLLSVSVWSGHAGDMGENTRTLFHWISALIALPAVVYAGQPFFRSALGALRARGLNMDVPISLAVVLASVMSLYQTIEGAQHAYFDASVSLLFFLLIGRYLDQRARSRARSAATHLLAMQARAATVIGDDGRQRAVRINEIDEGMTVLVAAGERVPVDGTVLDGRSDVDTQLLTGETMPKLAIPGGRVFAGTLNLTAPLRVRTTVRADGTLLSEIVKLMELAEQGRAKYIRLADRVASIYAPVVHILAAATFAGWIVFTDAGWQASLMAAIAVLIITCPCALGLAVPAVQVVASSRLLKAGVLVKAADALERLSSIDTVVFDKTGTLTLGQPRLVGGDFDQDALASAAALARHSRHPLSKALAAAADEQGIEITEIHEEPGYGLEGVLDGNRIRLGSRDWCGAGARNNAVGLSEICYAVAGEMKATFHFEDALREDAKDVLGALRRMGLGIELLSGDTEAAVARAAGDLGIDVWQSGCLPADKTARLENLAAEGRRVLMVGDGLNDAPSLVAAHVSMSPSSAADVSQTAADLLFQGRALAPVVTAIRVARTATRLVKQNFGLAFAYNAIAIPLAVAGLATPLVAAVAMSSSSIVVTLNALRLKWVK